jgi:hypothetical protein
MPPPAGYNPYFLDWLFVPFLLFLEARGYPASARKDAAAVHLTLQLLNKSPFMFLFFLLMRIKIAGTCRPQSTLSMLLISDTWTRTEPSFAACINQSFRTKRTKIGRSEL